MSLSEGHTFVLCSYLRFTRYKREQHAREVAQCVEDASDKLPDGEMFSTSEVRQTLKELRGEVDTYTKKEVQNAYACSALLVKLLMQQAEAAGVTLSVDTNTLENELLLKEINGLETAAAAKPASYYAKKPGLGGLGGALPKGPGQGGAGQEQLQAEVEALRGRLEALQGASNAALKDKASLADQLAQAQQQLQARVKDLAAAQQQIQQLQATAADAGKAAGAAQQAAAAGAAAAAAKAGQQVAGQEQVAALQKQLKEKEAEVRELKDTLSGRLQDSKQWQQMKRLMQAKGQEAVALRQRLAKYEPQEVASGDALTVDE